MKIVVCLKQVPDMSEAKFDRESNTIVRGGAASIINPYDINAVEEGLKIRDSRGGTVTALSMGIPSAIGMLKEVIAIGADDAILLTDKAFAGSDSLATSYTLSKAIEKLKKFDIILCGKQTLDGDTAQVGPSLAEKLGIPHITNVIEITEVSEDYLKCIRNVEKGKELVKTLLPAVITVEKDINTPRFPTIAGIRNMINTKVKTWNAEDIDAQYDRIGKKGSPTQVMKTFIPQSKTASEIIMGTPADQAKKLVSIFKELYININEG